MSSSFHGQMPKVSAFGHGICQNVMMVAFGKRSRIILRQQGEVVVLHEHDRVVAVAPPSNGVGESRVDSLVVLASPPRETSAARRRCGRAAKAPRWPGRSSSRPAPRPRATRVATCRLARPAAPRCDRRGSTVSRSALPLPCATQSPPQARITGSSAATRPLAGICSLIRGRRRGCECRARGLRPRSPAFRAAHWPER